MTEIFPSTFKFGIATTPVPLPWIVTSPFVTLLVIVVPSIVKLSASKTPVTCVTSVAPSPKNILPETQLFQEEYF